jgi:putative peptidoglycan lipid II flippase
LFAVPSNFLAAPLAIVAYPLFAREALQKNHGDLRIQVSRMFRLIVFLFLPLTIWTVLNALPLTRVFYERGQFRLEDSLVTARVLTFYGIGILPNAVAVVLLRCFYAIHDTITPLCAETIDLVFYIFAARVLASHFGIAGLALTRGMTFFLVALILIIVLSRKRDLLVLDFSLARFIGKALVASVVMVIVSWVTIHLLQSSFDSGRTPLRASVLCLSALFSGTAFFGIAHLVKLKEVSDVLNTAREMLRGSANRSQSVDGNLSFEREKSA